ncbi:MAG: hypothetical protein J6S60_06005 [Oscillospiraceae bacterium]|nr:hypothetical protein [Oscillospiraceae bacterium]
MLISEAISNVTALTGQVVENSTLVRWLSEIDGKLAFEFYRADAWTPYDPTADLGAELLVPFPWDGLYVHHLEAMTYFTNGEYDRYENARAMCEKKLDEFRHFMQRTQSIPCRPGFPTDKNGGTGVTVIPPRPDGPFFWLSAYALAVKHGFVGTEEEWLAAVQGPNRITDDTATALSGILTGNGGTVGSKAIDTSTLTDDNNHIPTSHAVNAALASENKTVSDYFAAKENFSIIAQFSSVVKVLPNLYHAILAFSGTFTGGAMLEFATATSKVTRQSLFPAFAYNNSSMNERVPCEVQANPPVLRTILAEGTYDSLALVGFFIGED